MSKKIYCIGKINNNETELELNLSNKTQSKKSASKRVNIVSIKMVKEKSILYGNRALSSPSDAVTLLSEFLEDSDREMLLVCCLDTKNQPTCINVVSIGTLNSSLVHPREVFKPAILSNSCSIIIAHNHPSGNPSPSKDDINITTRLKESGKILGIDLMDHIIIGENNDFVSLRNKGIM